MPKPDTASRSNAYASPRLPAKDVDEPSLESQEKAKEFDRTALETVKTGQLYLIYSEKADTPPSTTNPYRPGTATLLCLAIADAPLNPTATRGNLTTSRD